MARKPAPQAPKVDPSDDDEQVGTMLDWLQRPDAQPGATSAQAAPQKREQGGGNDQVASLVTQIAALQARLDERDAISQLVQAPPVAQQAPQAPQPVLLDMSGLPDPFVNQVEYTKQLQERIARNVQANFQQQREWEATQNRAAQSEDARYSGLWDTFVGSHPEFKGHEDKVEFIATKVAQRATQRGIDANRYMLGSPDRFFKDVIEEYNGVFGGGPTAQADGAPAPRAAANRTGGLPGGVESGAPSAGSKQDEDEEAAGTSLADDLKAIQRTSGMF